MADTPKTRDEWMKALHFIHRERQARADSPAQPDREDEGGDERLRHALEHMRAVMLEVGPDGTSLYVSPSIETITTI